MRHSKVSRRTEAGGRSEIERKSRRSISRDRKPAGECHRGKAGRRKRKRGKIHLDIRSTLDDLRTHTNDFRESDSFRLGEVAEGDIMGLHKGASQVEQIGIITQKAD